MRSRFSGKQIREACRPLLRLACEANDDGPMVPSIPPPRPLARVTRWERSRWRRRTRRSCGPGRVSPTFAPTSRSAPASTSPPTRAGRGATWGSAREGPRARRASWSIPTIRTSYMWGRWATHTARSRRAASSARWTAARAGSTCSSRTRTRARRASRWTPPTRAGSSRGCGPWRCTPGDGKAGARAAASTSRRTAATPGGSSRATGCRCCRWGRPTCV